VRLCRSISCHGRNVGREYVVWGCLAKGGGRGRQGGERGEREGERARWDGGWMDSSGRGHGGRGGDGGGYGCGRVHGGRARPGRFWRRMVEGRNADGRLLGVGKSVVVDLKYPSVVVASAKKKKTPKREISVWEKRVSLRRRKK